MSQPKVIIIGGGVSGLAVAEALLQKGIRATLFEKGTFAREASWAGGGFLDLRSASRVDGTFFEFCKRSYDLFPSWCERLHQESGIDPEYIRSGSLDLVLNPEEEQAIRQMERSIGTYGVGGEWVTPARALELEPGLNPHIKSAFYVEGTSQIRPPRLGRALVEALRKGGIELRENEPVEEFVLKGDRVQGVRTANGVTESDEVVLSAGPWSGALAGQLGLSLSTKPIRGQVVLFQISPGQVRRVLFNGLARNFLYLVPRRDGRVFAGSTLEDAGFEKTITPEGLVKLGSSPVRMAPGLSPDRIETSWAGLRTGSVDGWPYLGPVPNRPGLWLATGHYTHGLLQSAITGHLMAQVLTGEKPEMDMEAFSPGREPHAQAGI